MDRLQALRVFVAVAEAESFVAGARTLGLTGPSATRAVNELETALGARLFTRTTRKVRLTDAGRDFAEDVRDILSQLRAAEDAVTGTAQTPAGLLRITAPQEFGQMHVAPMIADFVEAWPDVQIEMLLVDRTVNLVEEGHDVALRIGSLPSSGLVGLRVGSVRRVLCGAPSYFRRFGTPQTPADLATGHRLVVTGSTVREWRFGRDRKAVVRLDPQISVNSVAASISIARQGWGMCRVFSYQVADDLEAGRLVAVLEPYEPAPAPVHIIHPAGRKTPAKLRAFIDFAAERLRRLPALRQGDGRV